MEPQSILILIIGILAADFLLEQTLEYINLKYQQTELPESLEGIYDQEQYRKAQAYHRDKTKFGFLTSTFNFALIIAVFATGLLGSLNQELKQFVDNPVLLALAFFGILYIASDLINIPFSWYNTFVIEERYGFNKMDKKTFVTDKLKGYLVTALIGGILLSVLFYLINAIGPCFWIWFWIVITLFLLFMNLFYTSLILPLFNKLTPMEDGDLKQKIREYCSKVNFPLTNIYIMDGSKRSSKANAFFSGLGKKKKIVLFDTLVKEHQPEELVAVLAHETGHYKKKHIITGFALSVLQTGIMLYIMSLCIFAPELSKALNGASLSFHLNLLAFGILYTPVSRILGIFMNIFSRKNEFEADAYAATTYGPQPLMEALKKLSVNNLSNMTPHPAYVFVHYSHPPVLQRLQELKKYEGG